MRISQQHGHDNDRHMTEPESDSARLLTYRGFSLIEVLISTSLLGLVMLGVLSMQFTAMHTARQSHFHQTALQLAAEMADNIRHHKQQKWNNKQAQTSAPATLISATELTEWTNRLQKALPHGRAIMCPDTTPWNPRTKELQWDCTPSPTGQAGIVLKIGWQGWHDEDGLFPPRVAMTVSP